jgi:hypothetical protein
MEDPIGVPIESTVYRMVFMVWKRRVLG